MFVSPPSHFSSCRLPDLLPLTPPSEISQLDVHLTEPSYVHEHPQCSASTNTLARCCLSVTSVVGRAPAAARRTRSRTRPRTTARSRRTLTGEPRQKTEPRRSSVPILRIPTQRVNDVTLEGGEWESVASDLSFYPRRSLCMHHCKISKDSFAPEPRSVQFLSLCFIGIIYLVGCNFISSP